MPPSPPQAQPSVVAPAPPRAVEPLPPPPSHLLMYAEKCVMRPGASASAPVRTPLCVQDLLRMRPHSLRLRTNRTRNTPPLLCRACQASGARSGQTALSPSPPRAGSPPQHRRRGRWPRRTGICQGATAAACRIAPATSAHTSAAPFRSAHCDVP
eukprot:1047857-Prymnesium_polylepis.1